jgi:hypothetical protein
MTTIKDSIRSRAMTERFAYDPDLHSQRRSTILRRDRPGGRCALSKPLSVKWLFLDA